MNPASGGDRKDQYISNRRPSRFVILSAAKDLCPARDPSLRSEPALERSEGMTILHRLRLNRKTSYLKCIDRKDRPYSIRNIPYGYPNLYDPSVTFPQAIGS